MCYFHGGMSSGLDGAWAKMKLHLLCLLVDRVRHGRLNYLFGMEKDLALLRELVVDELHSPIK